MHNWDDIRFFLAVARARSVSAASNKLKVNQSTVSRRIKAFEKSLDLRLFDRLKSGYQLTEIGDDLLIRAERIEQEARSIESDLTGKDFQLSGSIRVTTSLMLAQYLIMPMFDDFSRQNQEIELRLDVSNSLYNLTQREADIAIRVSRNDPPENLIARQLGFIQLAVFGHRDFVNEWRRNASRKAIPWLGEMNHDARPQWLDESYQHLHLVLRCSDVLVTIQALKRGMGIGRLPRLIGESEPDLVEFPTSVQLDVYPIWLLMHPDFRRVSRVLKFGHFLSEQVKAALTG